MIIASLGTGSIGLPDRDYYLRDDPRFKTTAGSTRSVTKCCLSESLLIRPVPMREDSRAGRSLPAPNCRASSCILRTPITRLP